MDVGMSQLAIGALMRNAFAAMHRLAVRMPAPALRPFTEFAFERASLPILVLAADSRVLHANQVARGLLSVNAADLRDRTVCDIGAQISHAEWTQWWGELKSTGMTQAEVTVRCPDGGLRPVEVEARLWDHEGRACAVVYLRDLSDRKRAQRVAAESESRFRAIFEQAAVGMAQFANDGSVLRVNRRACEILGYSSDELLGTNMLALTPAEDHQVERQALEALVAGDVPSYTRERQLLHRHGEKIWLNISVAFVRSDSEPYFIASIEDIHARKSAEMRAERLATRDTLTDLPNRVLLLDRLDRSLSRARFKEHTLAILHVDLDRFQKVTDTFGHAIGDLLLLQVAQRLQGVLRPQDTLARPSGDEFILLAQDLAGADDAARIAKTLLAAIDEPFHVQGQEIPLSASVGIALFPQDGWERDALMRNADIALSHAKRANASAFEFFNPAMTEAAHKRLRMETALRHAIERGELQLHYQPQVDVASGVIVGYEALARWQHPELGTVPPNVFIPIAEETGLIIPIGEWVLDTACRQAAAWHLEGRPDLRMAINVSVRQFADRCFPDRLQQIVRDSGVNSARLELEITESLVMQDMRVLVLAFDAVKSLGMSLAVDDFGTGHSNLQCLRRLPIDCVKIDRSFVRDLHLRQDDQSLVRAIIAMAHGLGLSVVAEGVEDARQLEFLRTVGCDQAQGYLFGKPQPAQLTGS